MSSLDPLPIAAAEICLSFLQVDRSKSHTIFSIPWSASLALCWYSWSIADSDSQNACVMLVSLNHASSFWSYPWVRRILTIFSLVHHPLLHCYSWIPPFSLPHLHVRFQHGDTHSSECTLKICCGAWLLPKALLVLGLLGLIILVT